MDVNPLHHGTTTPGSGASGVGATRRADPDGKRRGDGTEAESTEVRTSGGEPPGRDELDALAPRTELSAAELLQARDPVWDALVDEDGHRGATTEHVPANRGAAAYREASEAG